uniref:Uncharacterized protein n=1 Tax=Strix occidentalis caurina TaxID=311401 RepID=A0A8D0EP44_STROC
TFSVGIKLKQSRGTGDGDCGQFITRCLCLSSLLRGRTHHTLPLLHHGVSPTGDSPPGTSLTGSFPWGAALHKLRQCGSLLWATALPATDCSSAGRPASWLSSGTTSCSSVGSSKGCRGASAPPVTSMGAGAQPALSPRAAEGSLLWCTSPSSFLQLTSVFAEIFISQL